MTTDKKKRIIDIRHPIYTHDELYWNEWRTCYEGGPCYVSDNLKKFSERETDADFVNRKFFTPIPTYAKSAVNDIRNSIFQRLSDVVRRDGSTAYMRAVAGEDGGVDNKGSSAQSFFGIEVLTELLVMGRVGVYVDMPRLSGLSLADVGNARPYMYKYAVEDILSWSVQKPGQPGAFSAVLLRDTGINYNQEWSYGGLPDSEFTQYRYMWINKGTGKVNMILYDEDGLAFDLDGTPLITNDVIELDLDRIPFVMPCIGGSLLKDVYKHQTALLNLGSSDVAYALKANFPFYTEQTDMRNVGSHLKMAVSDEGSTVTSENTKPGNEVRVGVVQGRAYPKDTERPGFIHPSSEPLLASIKLQEKLEDDIRKLINLEVQNKVGNRVSSAEAMKMSDQGLEAGLSFIGLVMENTERQVAQMWAAYEDRDPSKRQIAIVKYPDRYSLKDDKDRIDEATALSELMYSVPGQTVKRELAKCIVTVLFSGKLNTDMMSNIFSEIDDSDYTTSDPETIIRAHEAGLVGDETASKAIGFSDEEYEQAQKDRVRRATEILEAQAQVGLRAKQAEMEMMASQGGDGVQVGMKNAGARGVKELALTNDEGKQERAEATDQTTSPVQENKERGPGKSLDKGEYEDDSEE